MKKLRIAKVILPIALEREFDYSIPDSFNVKLGSRLLVDFRGIKTVGILSEIVHNSAIEKIKPVIEVLDTNPALSQDAIKFAKQLSEYYPYPLGEFLFMMLPGYLKKPRPTDLPSFEKETNVNIPQNLFVKAETFEKRYGIWKKFVINKLKLGSVLIILPQISYLNEAKKIIEKDFPDLKVMHGYQTEKELFQGWLSTRKNSLILGSRMALFYYPYDLELVIIEEENSSYYFQEEKPFYHLFDVVSMLSKAKKIDIIFGAGYPSISAYNLISQKRLKLDENDEHQKEIKIVNIGEYKRQLISPLLVELLNKSLSSGQRNVIMWNKTGFGSYLACSSCGYIFKCERCSTFLKQSLTRNKGICPSCGLQRDLSKICKLCNSGYIRSAGCGIERIESSLKKIFPDIKIDEWEKKAPDTQIILATSKILSTIYGSEKFDNGFFLDADYQMSRLDYDATFDTYTYLKKLNCLFRENIYVFTRNKNHYLFKTINEPWKHFYDKELLSRKELKLPPYGALVQITLRARSAERVFERSNRLFRELTDKGFDVYGPLKEQPFKLRGKFRYYIIMKSKDGYRLRKEIKQIAKGVRSQGIQMAIAIH
ncbi:MAG: hypothetical protein M0R48_08175 [Candidatus Omnitrophica bacterium]|jgi:primosomal protein N' (replication factor Y)|nr:hypothetical protein [Candidatus Omnitrophota bacterium]